MDKWEIGILILCLILFAGIAELNRRKGKRRESYYQFQRSSHYNAAAPPTHYPVDPVRATFSGAENKIPQFLPQTSCCGDVLEDCDEIDESGYGCCGTNPVFDCDYSSKDVGLLEACR